MRVSFFTSRLRVVRLTACWGLAWPAVTLGSLTLSKGNHRRLVGNAAGIHVHLEVDVTILSPVSVPGVTHNPVGGVSVGVVAHELNRAVELGELGGAGARAEDTGGGGAPLRGVAGNGHRAVAHEVGLEGVLILAVAAEEVGGAGVGGPGVAAHAGAGDDVGFEGRVAGGRSASGGARVVGVVLLGVQAAVRLDVVLPSSVVPSTTAAGVGGVA